MADLKAWDPTGHLRTVAEADRASASGSLQSSNLRTGKPVVGQKPPVGVAVEFPVKQSLTRRPASGDAQPATSTSFARPNPYGPWPRIARSIHA
jgi:hypothetical protein